MSEISAGELKALLEAAGRIVLIDVLPKDEYEAKHIAGAKSACVYEINFLEQIEEQGITPEQDVVVYGAGGGKRDVIDAVEKLKRAGFQKVRVFSAGRAGWEAAGGVFVTGQPKKKAPEQPEDRAYTVDLEKSTVEWIGRSLGSTHRGTLKIASGELQFASGGQLASGTITLDMRTIENVNLTDAAMKKVLEDHLKSDDFFDVEVYPTAVLSLRSAKAIEGATPGVPNFEFAGDLTLKGVTKPIAFPALVSLNTEGQAIAVAHLDIDRTQWNVFYGSGKFYEALGMHLVNDVITILVKIVAV